MQENRKAREGAQKECEKSQEELVLVTKRHMLKMQGYPGDEAALTNAAVTKLLPDTLYNEVQQIWDAEEAEEATESVPEGDAIDYWQAEEEVVQANLHERKQGEHLVEAILGRRPSTDALLADPDDIEQLSDPVAIAAEIERATKFEHLVKWKGWGDKHNTWEPKEHLIDPAMILRAGGRAALPMSVVTRFVAQCRLHRLQVWWRSGGGGVKVQDHQALLGPIQGLPRHLQSMAGREGAAGGEVPY